MKDNFAGAVTYVTWKPIASAPRDGTWCCVGHPGAMRAVIAKHLEGDMWFTVDHSPCYPSIWAPIPSLPGEV